jgi:hypothetical protein
LVVVIVVVETNNVWMEILQTVYHSHQIAALCGISEKVHT